jgi:hypothetical protein
VWTSAVGLRWSVVVLRGRTHSRPRTYRICRIVRALKKRKFHIRKKIIIACVIGNVIAKVEEAHAGLARGRASSCAENIELRI